jgi:hypothetical protein
VVAIGPLVKRPLYGHTCSTNMFAVVYARVKATSNMFDEHVRAFKHVETFEVFGEHVCPCKGYVEHVRGSRRSSVNQARGHAYSKIKRNKHTRLDHRTHDRR